jgi:GT2 family glycosyltransferase
VAVTGIEVDDEAVAPGVRRFSFLGRRMAGLEESSLSPEQVAAMVEALAELRRERRIHQAVVFCQSPRWGVLALALRERFGWPVVYDRIDLHSGFSTSGDGIAGEDRLLAQSADLVTATSQVLSAVDRHEARPVVLLANACEPDHWLDPVVADEIAALPRPVIGYFGAISEWFDAEVVEGLSVARPDWTFVLVGSTWGTDITRLEVRPNVHLLGERGYGELPSLAAGFDVGLIPFRRTPLTEATDPVKLYEMLALGIDVVATPLPEIARHCEVVHLAEGVDEFLDAIETALDRIGDEDRIRRRREIARANTWEERTDVLERELTGLFPNVTIGIVTFNNRDLTELCLESIAAHTVHPNYEVVLVDNASEDGTVEWLQSDVAARPRHRVVVNETNRGFAAGCNQAFENSTAEYLCLLNNDTVVTDGWLTTMVRALQGSPDLGLVGPSSNGVANEARVEPGYSELQGLHSWAADFVWRHDGEDFSIPMLALFCALTPRRLWEEIGGLDEIFEVGLFEDDDYCRRVRRAGADLRCRRDAWVHHFHEASFGALPAEEYQRVYEANRKRFNEKWRREARHDH